MWRIAILSLSGACFYAAAFLREDEEGKLQNRLEELWVNIDDASHYALAIHTSFLRRVALLVVQKLSQTFGRHLLSWQAFGVSSCFSLASIIVALHAVPLIVEHGGEVGQTAAATIIWSTDNSPVIGNLAAVRPALWVSALLIAGLAPAVTHLRYLPLAVLVIAILWGAIFPFATSAFVFVPTQTYEGIYVLSALFVAFMCDLGFVAAVRITLKAVSQSSARVIVVTVVAQLLLAITLTVGLVLVHGRTVTVDPMEPLLTSYFMGPRRLVGVSAASNLFTLAVASLFLLISATLFLHRLFWPLISRPVYTLQRVGIFSHRRVLAASGLILLGFANARVGRALVELWTAVQR